MPVRAAQAAETLSRGERTRPRAAQAGFSEPLARGSPASPGGTRRICRLIVVLPAGNAAETSQQPRLPGYGEQPAPVGWREDQGSSRCQR